ncbi:OTU domain-containing protein [Legionella drozanskii]|uniref:Ankyrin repeats (3 copies) n=1 Tax=Legionella drozanskii LLAP-1 TaxID=1212489 RepID=A0A0W0SQU7_9GAMM|nr:hypothetical protein [Legionella drozanskii]KTC85786.1 Ankyrin repeats (3 copies) [Legionella drozanskii LLAP-1]
MYSKEETAQPLDQLDLSIFEDILQKEIALFPDSLEQAYSCARDEIAHYFMDGNRRNSILISFQRAKQQGILDEEYLKLLSFFEAVGFHEADNTLNSLKELYNRVNGDDFTLGIVNADALNSYSVASLVDELMGDEGMPSETLSPASPQSTKKRSYSEINKGNEAEVETGSRSKRARIAATSELHKFAADKAGCEEVIKRVEMGEDINAEDPDNALSPLEHAARTGSFETFCYLINLKNIDLRNPARLFKYVLTSGDTRMVSYVFDESNGIAERLNITDLELCKAVKSNRLHDLESYAECFTSEMSMVDLNPNDDLNACAFGNALFWAYCFNSQAVIEFLNNLLRQQIKSSETNKQKLITGLGSLALDLFSLNKTKEATELYSFVIELVKECSEEDLDDYHFLLTDFSYNKMRCLLREEEHSAALMAASEGLNYCHHIANEASQDSYKNALEAYREKIRLAINAKVYGFRCVDVNGDGSCFYYAMIEQLKLLDPANSELTPQQLRDRAARHIRLNFALYQDSILESERGTYLEQSLGTQAWVDHLFILALAREFNMNVVIIKNDDSDPDIFRQENPIATLFFGYELARHYQYLQPLDTDSTNTSIRLMIEQKEIDTIQTRQAGPLNQKDGLFATISDPDDFELRQSKAKLLVEQGCDPWQADQNLKMSPIEAAVLADDLEMFGYLFSSISMNSFPFPPGTIGPILSIALKEQKLAVLDHILATAKYVFNEENDLVSCLFIAVVTGDLSTVEAIYNNHPEMLTKMDRDGRSALYFSIISKNKEVYYFLFSKVQEFIQQGGENYENVFNNMESCINLLSETDVFEEDDPKEEDEVLNSEQSKFADYSQQPYCTLFQPNHTPPDSADLKQKDSQYNL